MMLQLCSSVLHYLDEALNSLGNRVSGSDTRDKVLHFKGIGCISRDT